MACPLSTVAPDLGIDMLTKRPRTPNDPYTRLTEQQISNIKAETLPHFHIVPAHANAKDDPSRPGGRLYNDRFCKVTSQHLVRGYSGTHSFGWIDEQYQRKPAAPYDSCRGRAAVRWGPSKAGERTKKHFDGEGIDRYTNIDMYRRNPTNLAGQVVMDCGRPADGYYAKKYPSSSTWFGSTAPLNRTRILDSVRPKTSEEYAEIWNKEQDNRSARCGKWPEFSEYTNKYLLQTKTPPVLNTLQQKKLHLEPLK